MGWPQARRARNQNGFVWWNFISAKPFLVLWRGPEVGKVQMEQGCYFHYSMGIALALCGMGQRADRKAGAELLAQLARYGARRVLYSQMAPRAMGDYPELTWISRISRIGQYPIS